MENNLQEKNFINEKAGKTEGAGRVSSKELEKAVNTARKIILYFVKEKFGDEILDRVVKFMGDLQVEIVPYLIDNNGCYDIEKNKIYIGENYFLNNKNNIDLICTLIHEHAHAFSYRLCKGEIKTINSIIEEAFAVLFVEMAIRTYARAGKTIEYESGRNDLKYHCEYAYPKEKGFALGIVYPLKLNEKDMKGFKEYWFGYKSIFLDICEEILGSRCREILCEDLTGYHDYAKKHIPEAMIELRDIVLKSIKSQMTDNPRKNKGLYNTNTGWDFLSSVYYENKLLYKYLYNVDFSTPESVASTLTMDDIERVIDDDDMITADIYSITLRFGYSSFLKTLIRGWYIANRNDLDKFTKIKSITGGVPLDIFKEIIEDQGIIDKKNILQLLNKLNVYRYDDYVLDDKSYIDVLEYINNIIGNTFYKEEFVEQVKKINPKILKNFQSIMDIMLELDLPIEDIANIMEFINYPQSDISIDDINGLINLKKSGIDATIAAQTSTSQIAAQKIEINQALESQKKDLEKDNSIE